MLIVAFLAGALVGRRLVEFRLIRRTLRHFAERRQALQQMDPAELELPHAVILLPLYKEQRVLDQLLAHVRGFDYPRDRLHIIFITTAKEPEGDSPSTRELLARLLAISRDPVIRHVHYPYAHDFRADQMNFVVCDLAAELPASDTYIGVYNADSLPDLDTLRLLALDACREKRMHGQFPPAYQQGVRYFVPRRAGNAITAHATAAFQTTFVFAHFLRRFQSATPGGAVPVTFAGHGEFVRLDALMRIGLFPNYAYADGLLLGWEVAFARLGIRVLPCCDHCEVPVGIKTLVRQHTAWFVGLLNLNAVVQQRFGGGYSSVSRARLQAFCARRMLSTLAWGMRTPFLLAMLGGAAGLGWLPFVTAVAAIACYAAAPVGFLALAVPQLSTHAPGAGRVALPSLTARIAASLPALLIDGIGFWPALWMKLAAGTAPPVPAKTER
jgi:cellulose synthase/poly-beta-1,6-N-acetylglucosamine synthase-like glycosyltransferase